MRVMTSADGGFSGARNKAGRRFPMISIFAERQCSSSVRAPNRGKIPWRVTTTSPPPPPPPPKKVEPPPPPPPPPDLPPSCEGEDCPDQQRRPAHVEIKGQKLVLSERIFFDFAVTLDQYLKPL